MKAVVVLLYNKQIRDPSLWGGNTGQEGMGGVLRAATALAARF